MTFRILYPYEGFMSADEIERRYMDALAANEIGLDYLDARTPQDMAEALDDMGFIRLAGKPDEYDTLAERDMDREPKEWER